MYGETSKEIICYPVLPTLIYENYSDNYVKYGETCT